MEKKRAIDAVKEFHEASGHPVSNILQLLVPKRVDQRAEYMRSEITEFVDATKDVDLVKAVDGLVDTYYFLCGTLVEMGVPHELFYMCFHEVHRANMTKFCKTEEEAYQTVIAYRDGTHPLKPTEKYEADYRKEGNLWIVYDVPTNKVLKSINTEEPDLEAIIERWYMMQKQENQAPEN